MQVSQRVGAAHGVRSALVAMATELNLDLLAGMGFAVPDGASANDMLVAVEAEDDRALSTALTQVDAILAERARSADGAADSAPPRTVRAAAAASGSTLALISTPGQYAAADAFDALYAGLDVMLFSDNVPLEQEIALKETATRLGLLVMGPDCGTAVVAGVGLGFVNVTRPGPVAIVAASGTGAQHLMCLLDGAGLGVSHCLGVGGRDLSEPVAARSTLAALDLLAAEESTERIVVVSKPPAPVVAERVRARAAGLGIPVEFALLGPGQSSITDVAERVVRAGGLPWDAPRGWPAPDNPAPRVGALRGLFSGGTLCDEAMLIAASQLGAIRSNVPLEPDWDLPDDLRAPGHLMIDFGDDSLTQGRPHPMIDGRLRAARLVDEGADPTCAVVLLDVVLGHGAHPDPAAELEPAIRQARATAAGGGRDLAVVVSLVGTAGDPQGLDRQAEALCSAGASVHLSNAAAAHVAVDLVEG
ncbi:MAG: FdrA family protein [Jiangellaceae bacterium]